MLNDEEDGTCPNCGEEWFFDGHCDECEEEEQEFLQNQLDDDHAVEVE